MPIEDGDGDARGRILAAAWAEFAAKGVAGARVDAIAKRAGASPQMIYYYFDSKEGLWREVLRRRVERYVGLLGEQRWPEPDDLSGYYETVSESGIRLLMWEALEYGKDQPLEEEGLRHALTRQFVEQIRQQQKARPTVVRVGHCSATAVGVRPNNVSTGFSPGGALCQRHEPDRSRVRCGLESVSARPRPPAGR